MLVAGAGTGGTITGVARKLKEKCPNIKVNANTVCRRTPGFRGAIDLLYVNFYVFCKYIMHTVM